MSDKVGVLKIMGVLSAAYPRMVINQGTLDVYAKMLSDLPFDALGAAIGKVISESTFFPTIAEIRSAAVEIMLNTDHIPSEGEAWEEAKRVVSETTGVSERFYDEDIGVWCVRHVDVEGSYSHPLIGKCVDVVGRENIPGDLEGVNRAHFCKVYQALLHRAVEDAGMLPEVRAATERYALGAGEPTRLVSGPMAALAGRLDARNAALSCGKGEGR